MTPHNCQLTEGGQSRQCYGKGKKSPHNYLIFESVDKIIKCIAPKL